MSHTKDLPELPAPDVPNTRLALADAYRLGSYSRTLTAMIQREAYDLGARSTAAQPVEPTNATFEKWLRTECFQAPTPEAYELAKAAWKAAASGDSTPPSIKFEINKDFPCSLPNGPRDVLATIELALTRGYAPSDILDENSPIRDRIRAELAVPIQGDPSGAPRAEPEAWLIRMSDGRRTVHTHNAIGDYRAIDPDATVVELFPRASAHLTGALRQQPEAVGQGRWQPIETAPKDGTVIDLWIGGEFPRREAECYWGKPHHECGEMGRLCDSDWHDLEDGWVPGHGLFEFSLSDGEITHWMPEPEPPQAASGSRGD